MGVWAQRQFGDEPEPVSPAESQAKATAPAAAVLSESPEPAAAQQEEEAPVEEEEPPAEPEPEDAQLLRRSAIDRSGGAAETSTVTVYYLDGTRDTDTLQPVEIQVPRTVSPIRTAVEQVLNAPTSLELHSGVPAGTKVQGVTLNPDTGVVTVDLSREAEGVQGTAAAENLRASLVYSLTEFESVKAVQLWVDGHPAVLHGVEWNEPVTREELNQRNLFHVQPVIEYEP